MWLNLRRIGIKLKRQILDKGFRNIIPVKFRIDEVVGIEVSNCAV
jgi:hypothetical protein